jgi:hypothetical protein
VANNRRISLALLFVFLFAVHLWFLLAVQLPHRELKEDVYPGSGIFHIKLFGDEAHFAFIAYHLNTRGLYSIDGRSPTAFRSPLFPLALAVIFRFTGNNALYGMIFNCLVTALLALATYRLCTLFWPPRIGMAAMALVGLSPGTFDCYVNLCCEPLFTLLFISSLIFLVLLNRRPTLLNAGLCGLTAGAAALTRAEGFLLIPIYFAYLAYRFLFKGQRVLAASLLFLAFSLLPLAPWVMRNYLSLNYLGLSTASGAVFAGAHNRRILDRHPGSWGNFNSYASPEEILAVKALNEVDLNRYLWQRGWKTLREYSLPYIIHLEVRKLFNTFKPSFRFLPKGHFEKINLILVAPFFFLYLLFFLILGKTLRGKSNILLLPLLVPVLVSLAFWGTIRWRIPYEPIIFSISLAFLIDFWYSHLRSSRVEKPG